MDYITAKPPNLKQLVDLDKRCNEGDSFYDTQTWLNFINNENLLIAIDGDKVFGVIRLKDDSDAVHIADFIVDDEMQNKSIGSELLKKATQLADAEEKPQWLNVSNQNHGAKRLYEKFGFAADDNKSKISQNFDIRMTRQPHTPPKL